MTKQEKFEEAIKNNDKDTVSLLLTDKRVDPSHDLNHPIRYSSHHGHIEIIKLLLKDKRVDPSDYNNWAIRGTAASEKLSFEILDLLWNDTRVKTTLKNNNLELYNKLVEQDIKNKVSEF